MNLDMKEPRVLTPIEKLLILQDRDRKIKQLSKESDDIPAHKALIDTRLNQHRANLKAAHDELMKRTSDAKQIDLEIETQKQRILKLREQQNNIKTNEEYKAIEREITNIQTAITTLEDKEIVVMEDGETVKARMRELEKVLKDAESVVGTDMTSLDERLKIIQAEVTELKSARAVQAAEIDPDWLSRYERIFKHTGDYGLVPLDKHGSCGGCHMKLPPQLVQDAKRGTAMISCSYCGRILYWRP